MQCEEKRYQGRSDNNEEKLLGGIKFQSTIEVEEAVANNSL